GTETYLRILGALEHLVLHRALHLGLLLGLQVLIGFNGQSLGLYSERDMGRFILLDGAACDGRGYPVLVSRGREKSCLAHVNAYGAVLQINRMLSRERALGRHQYSDENKRYDAYLSHYLSHYPAPFEFAGCFDRESTLVSSSR